MKIWLLMFCIFAPFSPQIDLYISSLFYSQETGFYTNLFFDMMFDYGEIIGLVSGAIASSVFVLSFFMKRFKKWRRASLSIVLTLVIGAGLIVNAGFKGNWARPRPKQIVEFGGKHAYRPFWHPARQTKEAPQKSFPSGHVSVGFYFLSLYLAGKRLQSKMLAHVGLFFTFFLGCGLMITRIVQGGHFVSDVLAAALIMCYVARAMDWLAEMAFKNRASLQSSVDSRP